MAEGAYMLTVHGSDYKLIKADGTSYTVTAAAYADSAFQTKLADYAADDTQTDVFSHTGVTAD